MGLPEMVGGAIHDALMVVLWAGTIVIDALASAATFVVDTVEDLMT